jgi:hypothetical protein
MFCDGWATVEDMADTLVERVHLSPEEAQSVADEARQAMGGVARAAPSPISPTVKLRQVLRSTVDPRLANQALEPHDKVLPGVRIPPPWVYLAFRCANQRRNQDVGKDLLSCSSAGAPSPRTG